jgi:ribosomal protein L11 methyltransferase
VGTGSGLLAIAAWKLGAGSVVALDNDPSALDNARSNLARNQDDSRVEIVEGNLEDVTLPPADVVVANLTGPMLERCSPRLMALARPGATAILSGFGPGDRHGIASAWMGWSVLDRRQDGEWSAVALVARG